ncbi:expressed unknown protein [Seminavis robusta]|uniref:Uncharacterized protein n=1 Tax=Seminavis robusta TaxID=568900 RepID=A0A9N8DHP9_9STRA|nr:expressed unknown protein [Seminavis robusta]|eukprot:Sro127_g060720.1 n/a (470) ;mRNA; f:12400-14008
MKSLPLLALVSCLLVLPSSASKLKGAPSRSKKSLPILPNGQTYDGRGEASRGLKAVAKGPPSRECKASSDYKYSTSKEGDADIKREVKFSCSANGESDQPMARGLFIDPADIRDKIEYKVKADKKGLTLKVEYKQEFQEEEGVDDFTDTAASYEVTFDSIIEYAKNDGKTMEDRSDEEQAYNWDDDLVLQKFELTQFHNFTNVTKVGDLSYWNIETQDYTVLFNFTVSQADMGDKVTANTMKIDVRILNFPWLANGTNLALMSSIKSELKVEVDFSEIAVTARSEELGGGDDKPGAGAPGGLDKKVNHHKWARNAHVSFENVTEDLGFIPFGDYKWDYEAEASTNNASDAYWANFYCDQEPQVAVQRSMVVNDTMCENLTLADADLYILEEVEDIVVVATYAPSMGNETQQQIAYSFVGPKAQHADEIYWDPEAGIGYETKSGAMSSTGVGMMVSAVLAAGWFFVFMEL